METLEKIKEITQLMSVDGTKFYQNGNKSAGIRARKYAQELKVLLQEFRKQIIEERKEENA